MTPFPDAEESLPLFKGVVAEWLELSTAVQKVAGLSPTGNSNCKTLVVSHAVNAHLIKFGEG